MSRCLLIMVIVLCLVACGSTIEAPPSPTLTLTSSPSPSSTPIQQISEPLTAFPLLLGHSWRYSDLHYETFQRERMTATYALTETVIATYVQPPFYAALQLSERAIENEAATVPEGAEPFQPLEDEVMASWYVISDTRLYQQEQLDLSLIKQDQATLEYIFPLSANIFWMPNPQQRDSYPTVEFDADSEGAPDIIPGLRSANGPVKQQVAAGSFETCFEIISFYNNGLIHEWFCPTVGVVAQRFDHSGSPFGYRTSLNHVETRALSAISALSLTLTIDEQVAELYGELNLSFNSEYQQITVITPPPMITECFLVFSEQQKLIFKEALLQLEEETVANYATHDSAQWEKEGATYQLSWELQSSEFLGQAKGQLTFAELHLPHYPALDHLLRLLTGLDEQLQAEAECAA